MLTTKMRIAVVEPVGGHSGMDYYDFGLCKGLTQANIEVTLYTCDETILPSHPTFTIKKTFRKIYGADPAWKRGLRYVRGILSTLMDAKRNKTKLVHYHYFHIGLLEFFNVFCSKLFRFKVVLTMHDVEPFVAKLTNPFLTTYVYRMADGIIAHSHIGHQELQTYLANTSTPLSYVPMGNFFHAIATKIPKNEACNALNIPRANHILLFFGQIKEVKGLDILLEAMPFVISQNPNTTLVIAGREWKDDFNKYQDIISKHHLESHCRLFIRFIQNSEVPLFYGAADLVVLPYKQIYQSAVLLMAMAYRKPVVASDLAGMAEIIKDGETGFLFSQGDPNELGAKINMILANEPIVEQVLQNASYLMETEYSWKRVGQLTANFFYTIC